MLTRVLGNRLGRGLVVSVLCGAAVVPAAALAGGKKKQVNARVTGGGSVFTTAGQRVTHGFELRCNPADRRQSLEVNWGGNRWHLLDLTAAYCYDDPSMGAGQPSQRRTPVDSYQGAGTGRYNGVGGATAQWLIQDDGEPGTTDRFKIKITDADGDVVAQADGLLDRGDHQFHFNR